MSTLAVLQKRNNVLVAKQTLCNPAKLAKRLYKGAAQASQPAVVRNREMFLKPQERFSVIAGGMVYRECCCCHSGSMK
jgi:hypothetical protein